LKREALLDQGSFENSVQLLYIIFYLTNKCLLYYTWCSGKISKL